MDRWVLRAWQTTPDLPLGSLSDPLLKGTRQRLSNSPEGQLLLARAKPSGDCAQTLPDAWGNLMLGTELALQRAGADRDHEQAIWSDRRRAIQKEREITSDPVQHLLETSHKALVRCAADDRAAGGALLAHAAMRWTKGCANGCDGLDRTFSISQAGRWHDDVEALADIWMVIATKESIDTMEVAQSTVMFRAAADDLLDLLMTLSPGGIDSYPLYVRSPNSTFWNRLGQSITEERITSWKGLKAPLCEILSDRARRANSASPDAFSETPGPLEKSEHLTFPR